MSYDADGVLASLTLVDVRRLLEESDGGTPTPPSDRRMPEKQPGEPEPVYLTRYGLVTGATATEFADHLRNRDGLQSTLARRPTRTTNT